jgi:hypothetical protein
VTLTGVGDPVQDEIDPQPVITPIDENSTESSDASGIGDGSGGTEGQMRIWHVGRMTRTSSASPAVTTGCMPDAPDYGTYPLDGAVIDATGLKLNTTIPNAKCNYYVLVQYRVWDTSSPGGVSFTGHL